jgi:hypothetical protein
MRLIRFIILLVPFILIWSSCFEKDKPVEPYLGNIYTINDDIEQYVSYFDLESGKVVTVHPADSWQLGFECSKTGYHIVVNSGAHWFLKNSGQTVITIPADTTSGTDWLYDKQSYFPASTAAGEWTLAKGDSFVSKNEVYFLAKSTGKRYTSLKQVVFLDVNESHYRFYYQDSGNNISDTITILKSDTANYVYYSFTEQKQVNLEPDKSAYEIIFGPYYDVVTEFGVTGPYLVRGVFINLNNTSVELDSLNTYASIDSSKVETYQNFSNRRDIIGYDWKVPDIDLSTGLAKYFIKSNYTYIIHTTEKNYFKFHFLSYESSGLPGVVQFEYEQIQ